MDIHRLSYYFIILAFVFDSAARRKMKFFNKWIIILLTYTIIVVLSISWSSFSYSPKILQHLSGTVFLPLFGAVIALNIFNNKERIELYIKNMIIVAIIVSVVSFFEIVFSLTVVHGELRATGGLGNPNRLAIFLTLVIPCVNYAIERRILPRTIGWSIIFVIFGGIICTVSRKGIVAAYLALFLCFALRKQFRKAVALVTCGIIFISLISSIYFISGRFSEEKVEYTMLKKHSLAAAGMKMFAKSPVIGHGFKGYHAHYSEYFPYSSRESYDAHNIYVTALANYGLLGFIPFLGIMVYPLVVSFKILRYNDELGLPEYSRDLAVLCISSVLPFMLGGYFSGGLINQPVVVSVLYTQITFLFHLKRQE
jgi:O-antigen ligase